MPTTIITGGNGGIGAAAAARILAGSPERHCAVVDRERSDELPAPLRDDADRVHPYACDVSDPAEVGKVAEAIAAELPPADSLVNGAGIVDNTASIDVSIDVVRTMMGVHVDGSLLWSQALARQLNGAPGAIVNVGSVIGRFGHPRRAAYAMAKAAIHSLTETLAVEWALLNIRVNAVLPGYIATPLVQEGERIGLVDMDSAKELAAMKRMGTPEEVAGVIAFLLGDEASFITGHLLDVDGGFAVLKAE